MKVLGYQTLTVTGSSSATSSLPLYIDFYMTLDVSGSMGLPSTPSEALRMQAINPDNFVQYPTGCTLACHFAPQNSACIDTPHSAKPLLLSPRNPAIPYRQLLHGLYIFAPQSDRARDPHQKDVDHRHAEARLPACLTAMLGRPESRLLAANPLITGNSSSLPYSVPAASSCPTQGSDACIQLRLDAVGVALIRSVPNREQPQSCWSPINSGSGSIRSSRLFIRPIRR